MFIIHGHSKNAEGYRDTWIKHADKYSFMVVAPLFDAIKIATGNESSTYLIYGHSEGGQVVQHLVLFLPDARNAKAVAANPGL